MKPAFFSAKKYEMDFFRRSNEQHGHELVFLDVPLDAHTAVLAKGHDAVCIFVNDRADAEVVEILSEAGVQLIALRCAGFNNVDLVAAKQYGIQVVRVPAYSPYAIAEHTLALILTLNRRTHRAYNRVREGNFSLNGLMGFDLNGKTVGLIGLGKIGLITAQILKGFGCRLLGYDIAKPEEADTIGIGFSDLDELYASSDIISLHCPLNVHTHHLINERSIAKMKPGVMLINTSRGALIDTPAVVSALKDGQIKYLGLDVYEEEEHLFFQDLSETIIQDDVFSRLLAFNNVLITGHQAFLTGDAVGNIADTTLQNLSDFEQRKDLVNEVHA